MSEHVKQHEPNKEHFTEAVFHRCEREFSEYLLGEVRDYLGFYYGTVDSDQIVGFFSMLDGKNNFTWEELCRASEKYLDDIPEADVTVDELKGKPKEFLQFLYSLNIVGYLEPENSVERCSLVL